MGTSQTRWNSRPKTQASPSAPSPWLSASAASSAVYFWAPDSFWSLLFLVVPSSWRQNWGWGPEKRAGVEEEVLPAGDGGTHSASHTALLSLSLQLSVPRAGNEVDPT